MAERKVSTTSKSRTVKGIAKSIPLDQAIAALQQAGYAISPPTTSEELKKHEASKVKLGLKKAKVEETPKEKLVAFLTFRHSVGTEVHGPGRIELEPEKLTLFQTLIYQDGLSKQGMRDTTDFVTTSRCFIIQSANRPGLMQHRKQEISEHQFNNIHMMPPSITAGAIDAAGYNPSYNPNGVF